MWLAAPTGFSYPDPRSPVGAAGRPGMERKLGVRAMIWLAALVLVTGMSVSSTARADAPVGALAATSPAPRSSSHERTNHQAAAMFAQSADAITAL